MSLVAVNESTMTDIADALREKKKTTDTYKPKDMAQAVRSIVTNESLPEEAFVISGNCTQRFAYDGWSWFIEQFGNSITTDKISNANSMFNYATITEIPFELNFVQTPSGCANMFSFASKLIKAPKLNFQEGATSYTSYSSFFSGCQALKEVGTIEYIYPSELAQFFNNCYNLRFAPEFKNVNWSRIQTHYSAGCRQMFYGCYSLRQLPRSLIDNCTNNSTTSYLYPMFYNMLTNCYTLDEATDIPPQTGAISSASTLFQYFVSYTYRLKRLTFAVQSDGTPYTAKWKGATIDCSVYCGHGQFDTSGAKNNSRKYILDYNSGITADKEVYDDATYQALKDDPDWFTVMLEYSRYNHDSAVETINSLPDTSAYGTNTIKFRGGAGSLTDGGAINTLTEEEIAVATSKGWTVTLV